MRFDPFEYEGSIFDGTIHEESLRHVRFVRSMSFRAARIVAANRMANFLSSVTRESPAFGMKFR